jgi:hypothetical protein
MEIAQAREALTRRREELLPQQRHPVNKAYLTDVVDTLALVDSSPAQTVSQARTLELGRARSWGTGTALFTALGVAGLGLALATRNEWTCLAGLTGLSVGLIGGLWSRDKLVQARRNAALLDGLGALSPPTATTVRVGSGNSPEDLRNLMQATREGLPEQGLGVDGARGMVDRDLATLARSPGRSLEEMRSLASVRQAHYH